MWMSCLDLRRANVRYGHESYHVCSQVFPSFWVADRPNGMGAWCKSKWRMNATRIGMQPTSETWLTAGGERQRWCMIADGVLWGTIHRAHTMESNWEGLGYAAKTELCVHAGYCHRRLAAWCWAAMGRWSDGNNSLWRKGVYLSKNMGSRQIRVNWQIYVASNLM